MRQDLGSARLFAPRRPARHNNIEYLRLWQRTAQDASAPLPGIVASPPASQQQKDFRLGRNELSVLLEDGPATDIGVHYYMSDLVSMRRRDLIGVLSSMGQSVGKRRPTRLELLGAVVTLLCDMNRLRL